MWLKTEIGLAAFNTAVGGGQRAGDAAGVPRDGTRGNAGMAASSVSIAFGDFKRGYLIADRVVIPVLVQLQALRAVLYDQTCLRQRSRL
jgi:hypothetical protein